jgi:DNA-binding beta-propeller fold protein YncE
MAGLAACGGRHATGFPGFAVISLAGENGVAIVNLNTFKLDGRREFRTAPSTVASSGDTAYVLTPANGTVHAVNPNTPKSSGASTRLSGELDFLRLTTERNPRLVTASSANRELVVARLSDLRPERRVRLQAPAASLDIGTHAGSRNTYAALSGGKSGIVELVNLENGTHRKCELEGELGGLRFRRDGKLIFVANYGQRSLVVLDTESLQTVCELPVPMQPRNLAFGAKDGQLFISGPGMDAISIVYVYNTVEVDQTVLAAREPGAMACSDNPRYLFVASRSGPEVTILNIDTRKIMALTLTGSNPSRIVITPDQQYALVLDNGSGDLAVIRIPEVLNSRSRRGASSLPSGILTLRGIPLFAMIPIGAQPVDIAIANQTG